MIANRWNFNICFHLWGSFHLVFALRAPKKRCDYFWPVFWPENAFSPFSYTGGLLSCKNEKLNCFDIQCVVEASSFSLNHNMTLESKENYPRHTKIVQNSLGFMPEVKPLHKPRGDLVLCALKWHYHTSCLELINKAILLTHEVYVRLLYLIKCLISPAHQVCFVLLLTFLKYLKIFSPYKLILMLVTIETNILSDKFTWWLKKKKKKTNVTRRDVTRRDAPWRE